MINTNRIIEKDGAYEYEIIPHEGMWVYDIYDPFNRKEILVESSDWFETQQEARFAAIGHISLLENGEG